MASRRAGLDTGCCPCGGGNRLPQEQFAPLVQCKMREKMMTLNFIYGVKYLLIAERFNL